MMSDDMEVTIGIRDEATANLIEISRFANQTGREVMQTKQEALKNIRDMRSGAIRFMSGFRLLTYAFAGAIDPLLSAVLNIVGSIIETLYALATAEGSTILGLPAAAVHGAIATTIQVITLPAIINDIEEAKKASSRALAALDAFALFGGW